MREVRNFSVTRQAAFFVLLTSRREEKVAGERLHRNTSDTQNILINMYKV